MKTLNYHDFECTTCGMPAEPGVCELCRLRAKLEPGSVTRHYLILAAIAVIAILVLLAGLAFAASI